MEVVNTKQDFEIVLLFRLTSNQIWLIPFMGRSANCLLEKFEKKTVVSQHFYCKVLQKIMASIFMLCIVLQYMWCFEHTNFLFHTTFWIKMHEMSKKFNVFPLYIYISIFGLNFCHLVTRQILMEQVHWGKWFLYGFSVFEKFRLVKPMYGNWTQNHFVLSKYHNIWVSLVSNIIFLNHLLFIVKIRMFYIIILTFIHNWDF